MNTELKREWPLLLITALPFLYLAYIWTSLPEKVPLHWNFQGEIDRYGSKMELLLIPILLPLLTYVILLAIPYVDPKKQIQKMGGKYQKIKMIFTVFMTTLSLFIIYTSANPGIATSNYLLVIIGGLYLAMGNYFKTIKANYFIGIRTPWTLENEKVWKSTHELAGAFWFLGGLLVIVTALVLSHQLAFVIMLVITAIITLVPVVYSYFKYKAIAA